MTTVAVSMRLAMACLAGLLASDPAVAQQCDGVELLVEASERRCLRPGAGERFKDCVDCPEMVVVPAGTFLMGSPPSEPEREGERENQVQVTIARPLAIGAFAVTRGEFGAFVAATDHKLDEGCYFWTGTTWEERTDRSWQDPGFAQDDRHPVTCIDLNAAKAYAAWLSIKTGKSYRLPPRRSANTRRALAPTRHSGGAPRSRRTQPTTTAPLAMGRARKASGGRGRSGSTASVPMPGVSIVCMATFGIGRMIAGMRATLAILETAAQGQAVIAPGVSRAAGLGTTVQTT